MNFHSLSSSFRKLSISERTIQTWWKDEEKENKWFHKFGGWDGIEVMTLLDEVVITGFYTD